jgi:hypothetical protein
LGFLYEKKFHEGGGAAGKNRQETTEPTTDGALRFITGVIHRQAGIGLMQHAFESMLRITVAGAALESNQLPIYLDSGLSFNEQPSST